MFYKLFIHDKENNFEEHLIAGGSYEEITTNLDNIFSGETVEELQDAKHRAVLYQIESEDMLSDDNNKFLASLENPDNHYEIALWHLVNASNFEQELIAYLETTTLYNILSS